MTHRLFGEVPLTLDKYYRVPLPHHFLADLAAGIVVTRGIDQCLMAFPIDEWQNLTKKIGGLPLLSPLAREFCRLIYSGTELVALAQGNRVSISQHLRDYAQLDREVIVVGLGTHLEIWRPDIWRDRRREFEQNARSDALHWAALPL